MVKTQSLIVYQIQGLGNCFHNNSPNKGQLYTHNLHHFEKDLLQQAELISTHTAVGKKR